MKKIEDISFVRDVDCMQQEKRFQILEIQVKSKRERTRDDKHDDYLEWWQKSKKEKQEN